MIFYLPHSKETGFKKPLIFDEWSKDLVSIAIIPYDVIITFAGYIIHIN